LAYVYVLSAGNFLYYREIDIESFFDLRASRALSLLSGINSKSRILFSICCINPIRWQRSSPLF